MRIGKAGKAMLWLVGIGILFLPLLPDPPLHSGAYVQDVRETSAIVACIDATARRLSLEVTAPDGKVVEVALSPDERRHALRAEGLRPDTDYRFVLRDEGGGAVDQGSFRTAGGGDSEPVKFAVVGDSGGLPWWVWLQDTPLLYLPARFDWLPTSREVTAIGRQIAAWHPQLVIHVGDVVYPRGENRHYTVGFFRPFAEVLRHAPMYAVLGNHDFEYNGGKPFFENFHLPPNDLTNDENFWTTVRGPVRFVGLNLNAALGIEPSRRFLEHVLSKATEPWVFVFQHFPYLSASRSGEELAQPEEIRKLVPTYEKFKVDIVFTGHDHDYQRFGQAPDTVLLITGGGGKSLYDLRDVPGLVASRKAYEFCAAEVRGSRLEARIVDLHGVLLDSFIIDKRSLVNEGKLRLDPANARDRRLQKMF